MKVRIADISIRDRFESGQITLKEAAREFCRLGWTNFVDEEAAMRYMNNCKNR